MNSKLNRVLKHEVGSASYEVHEIGSTGNYIVRPQGRQDDSDDGDAIDHATPYDRIAKILSRMHPGGLIWDCSALLSIDPGIRRVLKGYDYQFSKNNWKTVMVSSEHLDAESLAYMQDICPQAETIEQAIEMLTELPREKDQKGPKDPSSGVGADKLANVKVTVTDPLLYTDRFILGSSAAKVLGKILVALLALLLGFKDSWSIASSFVAGGAFVYLLQIIWRSKGGG